MRGDFVVFDDNITKHNVIRYEDLSLNDNEKLVNLYGNLDNKKLECLFSSFYDDSSVLIQKSNINVNLDYISSNYEKNLLCLTTSGTSGAAKLIAHDKHQFFNKFNKKRKDYKTCLFMPWYHVGGLDTLLYVASNNSTCYIPSSYNVDYFLKFVKKFEIEVLALTPSYLNLIMLSCDFQKYLESVKIITCGAEPFMHSVMKIMEYCPWIKIIQKYGTTETGSILSKSLDSDPSWIKFKDDESWMIDHNNMLLIKNKNSCKWSYDSNKLEYTALWKNTGDYVEVNNDGYIKILGRKNEIIIVGGRNVYPQYVRSKMLELSYIADAKIYGKQNNLLGEVVCADIVTSYDVDKNVILKDLKKTMDFFEIPVFLNFVDKINYNDRHKMEKRNG
jgi:acyl-coenzyme A synthetase/AMP-(fatty) acid ligase